MLAYHQHHIHWLDIQIVVWVIAAQALLTWLNAGVRLHLWRQISGWFYVGVVCCAIPWVIGWLALPCWIVGVWLLLRSTDWRRLLAV